MDKYDVIIIGAGPGGYVTAIRSAQLGLKTCIVENRYLGGICLNWGCIPTKALLRSAEVYHLVKNANAYGVSAKNANFDLPKIVQRSRNISKQLNNGVKHLLKKNKVTVIMGTAKLLDPHNVEVTSEGAGKLMLNSAHVIIATGAQPKIFPNLELVKEKVWTYFEAMVPKAIPKTILVIGSGAIGVEFASFYCALGSNVTIVEMLPNILPNEDHEISAIARKKMEDRGIKIITDAKITELSGAEKKVKAFIEQQNGEIVTIEVEKIISAIGVKGNIDGLGLEKTRVKTLDDCIVTHEFGLTDEPGIYAIGDVSGPPMLAHKAEHEGVACVENIAGLEAHKIDKNRIPSCTYSFPQIASVGLTQANAEEAGYEIRIGKFSFIGNGKAIALGESDGLVKTIFNSKTGELLGAHMVGADVTELIQGFVIAIGLETTEKELMNTIFPHPTLSEMMHESVLDAYERVIHM